MNLNDNRINAYKKIAGKADTEVKKDVKPFAFTKLNVEDSVSKKNISTPTPRYTTKEEKTQQTEKTYIEELMGREGLLKLTKNHDDGVDLHKESLYRRVAKFLLILGVDEAAKILPFLPADQVDKIIPEIASIRSVTKDEQSVILAEFKSIVEKNSSSGGVNTARTILTKAFGKDKASEMIEKSVPYPNGKPFEYLQNIDSEKLFFLLKDESLPVQTLVLSKIKPTIAASFINKLDEQTQKAVVMRLAKMAPMSPDIVKRVDNAMAEKVKTIETGTDDRIDGRGALAEILKKMDVGTEKDILTTLTYLDPDLSNDIRERLFTIEDVLAADDRFIQEHLRKMSEKDIAYLISNKEQSFRLKILDNISTTRGTLILEEESLAKPMRKRDIDEITNAFFTIMRKAWEEGKLIIKGRDEEYV